MTISEISVYNKRVETEAVTLNTFCSSAAPSLISVAQKAVHAAHYFHTASSSVMAPAAVARRFVMKLQSLY